MKKIKLLSLFSGVGAFEKALERLGVEYDLVNYCEVDKYASKAYALIHNCSEEKNLGDITKVDARSLPHDIDLITYGFPCQDISLAGKQKGFTDSDGNKTRSGLFFDALRIIDETKPKVAIAENVKNLVSKKFKNEFEIVLNSLDQAGYNSYYKVINAKDCGIPQNRERVFIVSIRKDIDPYNIMFSFPFPEKEELKLRLKDMLEDEVDEKYYLSDAMIERLTTTTYESGKFENRVTEENGVVGTLCARDYKDPKCVQIGNLKGGNTEPKIAIKNKTKQGYLLAEEGDGVDVSGRMQYHRGTVQKGISQTLSTAGGNNVGVVITEKGSSYARNFGSRGKLVDTEGTCDTLVSAMGTGGGNVPIIKTLWTETQAKMITPDGNIKRYIGSDVVDEFKEGQAADISFPNGYNKGPRVHDECPAINITTTKNSFIVKSKDKRGNVFPIYKDTKQLRETIENNEFEVGEPLNLDLYNRATYEQSQTLCNPTHNSQRLFDGLRIRKLTPKECWRLMGFDDKDVDILVSNGMSNTQLYKQAGNSIVVDVLEKILFNLFNTKILDN